MLLLLAISLGLVLVSAAFAVGVGTVVGRNRRKPGILATEQFAYRVAMGVLVVVALVCTYRSIGAVAALGSWSDPGVSGRVIERYENDGKHLDERRLRVTTERGTRWIDVGHRVYDRSSVGDAVVVRRPPSGGGQAIVEGDDLLDRVFVRSGSFLGLAVSLVLMVKSTSSRRARPIPGVELPPRVAAQRR